MTHELLRAKPRALQPGSAAPPDSDMLRHPRQSPIPYGIHQLPGARAALARWQRSSPSPISRLPASVVDRLRGRGPMGGVPVAKSWYARIKSRPPSAGCSPTASPARRHPRTMKTSILRPRCALGGDARDDALAARRTGSASTRSADATRSDRRRPPPARGLPGRRRHGDMHWMADTIERRGDPVRLWPQARSAVGMSYAPAEDPLAVLAGRHAARSRSTPRARTTTTCSRAA